ncbi:hypothetical protein IQ07DRAFT_557306 [Pyrenochaeta sp. DS3sAY3a]|nr:hypothetical protein IQ07DRAFT_557306 [Pyrenochaeta sp. DS3sAY3a]
MEKILVKLKNEPGSITTEDARRLSENVEVNNEKSARIISAVESFAVANESLHEEIPPLGQPIHSSLLTIVMDLQIAVQRNPGDVTDEVLRTTQSIVTKMQKAMGFNNAPRPELEAELQEEIAKIEPKIAQGTVTKREADHLHSLESRVHGRTEKGGITALAQSIVAKRERQLTQKANDSGNATGGRPRANSKSLTSTSYKKYSNDQSACLPEAEVSIKSNIDRSTPAVADVDAQPGDTRAPEIAEKAGPATTPRSLAYRTRNESLSDRSNVSPRVSDAENEHRKEQSQSVNAMIDTHLRENSQPLN